MNVALTAGVAVLQATTLRTHRLVLNIPGTEIESEFQYLRLSMLT